MTESAESQRIRESFKQSGIILKLIWGGVTASMLLYVLFVYTALEGEPVGLAPTLELALQFMAVGAALGSVAWRRITFSRRGLKVERRVGPFFTNNIITWAMNEAVCLAGFMLAILSRDPTRIYLFAAVAVLLQIFMFPRVTACLRQ